MAGAQFALWEGLTACSLWHQCSESCTSPYKSPIRSIIPTTPMGSHIDAAIRDVAPTLADPLPESLRQLTERYYASSRQKITLKQHEEVARYHICAIVAVSSHSQHLNIAAPTLNNVPLPASNARQLVQLFTTQLGSRSATATPISTPRKRKQPSQSPQKAPTPNGELTTSSTKKKPRSGPHQPPSSKTKTPFTRRLEAAANGSPQKSSPSKKLMKKLEKMASNGLTPVLGQNSIDNDDDEEFIPQSPEKQFILLSSREITALCNKFQIEEKTTKHIIETFQQYYTKVTNEWVLICGLILNCYLVINHEVLSTQMGAKTTTFKTMFNLQNGGLMLNDINSSIGIVKSLIEYSRWFKKLKLQHNYPEGGDTTGAFVSGSMISARYQFHSPEAQKAHQDWLDSIQEEIAARRTQQM